MASGTFAAAINCIDGRAQSPVSDWVRVNYNVSYVDTITIPGADKIVAEHPEHEAHLLESLRVSVEKHGSKVVAIAGHYECAANPASAGEHIRMIRAAAQRIYDWGLGVRVVGLWVNEHWMIDLVADLPAR